MKFQQVETIPIEIPLTRNFGGSTYNVLKRCAIITRVRTNEAIQNQSDRRRRPVALHRSLPKAAVRERLQSTHIADDVAKWVRVAKAAGIKAQ